MTTARDVAAWMAAEVERTGELDKEDAVDKIQSRFGSQFTFTNENGNLAIDRAVLREFRKLTEASVV